MGIKPVNPSIYPSPNPSGIKIAFNIDDSPTTNLRKEENMIDARKEVSCTRCLHQEVCKYKQDFLDICNKVKTTPITNLDFLGGIQIECRYYQMQVIDRRLFDPVTNPCITATNHSTLSNTISATNKED